MSSAPGMLAGKKLKNYERKGLSLAVWVAGKNKVNIQRPIDLYCYDTETTETLRTARAFNYMRCSGPKCHN